MQEKWLPLLTETLKYRKDPFLINYCILVQLILDSFLFVDYCKIQMDVNDTKLYDFFSNVDCHIEKTSVLTCFFPLMVNDLF